MRERVIFSDEYFTKCIRIGCDEPAVNHPLRCDKHRYYWLPCTCPILHEGGCNGPVFYNYLEYAKAQRLAAEQGWPEGFVVPYKTCDGCGHYCQYMLLGTSHPQLEGWPD